MYELCVYILRCNDGSYYTGITNDIERRMDEHATCENPKHYVFKRRPVKLVHTAYFREHMDAIRWETTIKGWSRKKKEALIAGEYEKLPKLACMKGDWDIAMRVRRARFRVMVSLSNQARKEYVALRQAQGDTLKN